MVNVIVLLVVLFQQPDSIPSDTLRADTLREVTVKGDTILPVLDAILKTLKEHPIPKRPPGLGDILDKYAPGLQDRITHPLAIKDRKREKRKRKHQKILHDYDRVIPFEYLLRQAYIQLQQEDSLEKAKEK
ncbi:MAG: hypothetical protein IJR87_05710 [Bacteroidaceae bacterium]|nr:hypothetical protein [Bacteroidaceae bacterium]